MAEQQTLLERIARRCCAAEGLGLTQSSTRSIARHTLASTRLMEWLQEELRVADTEQQRLMLQPLAQEIREVLLSGLIDFPQEMKQEYYFVTQGVGSSPAREDTFSDCVVVLRSPGDLPCGSAVLISPNVALTAAHVVNRNYLDFDHNGTIAPVSGIGIGPDLNELHTVAVADVKCYSERDGLRDVALLFLETSVPEAVRQFLRPLLSDFRRAGSFMSVGYGAISSVSMVSEGERNAISFDRPKVAHIFVNGTAVKEADLLTGNAVDLIELGRNVCELDSGGALYTGSAAGAIVVAGVTLRKADADSCAKGSRFLRVDRLRGWIDGEVRVRGFREPAWR